MSSLRPAVAVPVLLMAGSAQVLAGPVAASLALRNGEVLRLDLVQDGTDIQPAVIAQTSLPGSVVSLTLGTDRLLYGDYREGTTLRSLVRIDPDTGDADVIGELVRPAAVAGLPSYASSDMATLADGTILTLENPLGVDATIYSVDIETAELTYLVDAPGELRTIGESNGVLYGIVRQDPKYPTYALASLDLVSGAASPISDLAGIECESGNCRIPTAMAFDSSGGLWVNVLALIGLGVPDERTYFYYYAAPETGRLTAVSEILSQFYRGGMVVLEPDQPVVEIPTLQTVGLAVLALVLASAAVTRVPARSPRPGRRVRSRGHSGDAGRRRRAARGARPWQVVFAALLSVLLGSWGCSAVRAPGPSPVPCSRVVLEPPPPWTASAAWNPSETEMLLVDPGTHSLATYGRDGSRRREILLDDLAEIDYSVPVRLERVAGGYLLIDKTQVLSFDDRLSLRRRSRPFAGLEERGILEGSFNDVLDVGGELVGYADFVDRNLQPENDPKAEGTWRRGFVRLDPAASEIDFLHELPLDGDDEYAAYYLYDRRPYVSELDGKVYVLRFTDPWTVHRVRRGTLRQVASGSGDGGEARALHAWNGRLYVLTGRIVPAEDEGDGEPTEPVLHSSAGARAQAELLQAMPASASGKRRWVLHEIEPSSSKRRQIVLPTSAERLRLVPGRTFWTAVEETTVPNLGQGRGTSFLFLPATEILDGAFGCLSPSP